MKKTFFIPVLLLLLISSCKKYEVDPLSDFKINVGNYQVESIYLNGENKPIGMMTNGNAQIINNYDNFEFAGEMAIDGIYFNEHFKFSPEKVNERYYLKRDFQYEIYYEIPYLYLNISDGGTLKAKFKRVFL